MVDVARLEIQADSSSVKTAGQNLAGFSQKATLATRAMRVLAPVMAAALSARLFSNLAAQANEFNAALGEVSTLLTDAAKEMPTLTQNAKLLAAQFGGSPTQQAQAFYQAISAGASNAVEATSMLTAANKLAIGGVTDVTTAVDGLTSIVNAFGLEANQAADVSDAMFTAMRAGKTTVGELSGNVGKVAALASTAGLSFQELLGATSALTTGGVATSEAMTGLKAALTNILKPSGEAKKISEALGLQFDMQSIQAKGLQQFLKDLVDQTAGNQEAMLGLFGSTEALNAVFALTGSQAETFDNIMEDMGKSLGQTDLAFSKMSNTMTQKLEVLKGKFAATAVEVGNFVVKATEPIVDHLNANFDAYTKYWSDLKHQAGIMLEQIWKIWSPFFKNIADGFKAALDFIINLFTPFVRRFVDFVRRLATPIYEFFKGIVTGAESAMRAFINNFRTGFSKAQEFVERTKLKIVDFYETMKIRAMSLIDSQEETERKLAELDEQRKQSLRELTNQFDSQREAIVLVSEEAKVFNGIFNILEDTTVAVKDGIVGLGNATLTLKNGLVDVAAQTARFEAGQIAAARSVGVLKNQVTEQNDSVINLVDQFDLMAKPTSGFRMVTQEMETQAIRSAEVSKQLELVAESTAKVSVEQATLNTFVENTQTSFADLIKGTLDSGKLNFKSFFESIKEGWKNMVAEIAAKKLMDAIFGTGGIDGFMSTITGALGSIGSKITSTLGNVLGIGGGSAAGAAAASSAAGGAAGTSAATAAAGGAAGGGLMAGGKAALATAGTAIKAVGAKALALATNPLTLGIAGAALLADSLDDSGTMSSNAGMLTTPVGDGTGQFDIAKFASGAQFTGFTRRKTEGEANNVIDTFRTLDNTLTNIATAAGLDVNLSASNFIGRNEKGKGTGAFFGLADEDGGSAGDSLDSQLTDYSKRWLTLVAGQNQVNKADLDSLLALGSHTAIVDAVTAEAKRRNLIDGSHAGGVNSIPYDGYIAELHKGERVQTAAESKRSDFMVAEMSTLRGNLNELMLVVAKAVNKTARIESRWDIDGLPPTRT